MSNIHVFNRSRVLRAAVLPVAAFAIACTENLPIGPNNFSANLVMKVAHDTIVIGDSSVASASAADAQGRTIQALTYVWKSADSATVGFAATATPDATQGASRTLVGKKTGLVGITVSLPDFRFSSSPATRTETGVVGGVRVLTSHDSTLTSVNDTGVAIGAGLARANGQLVSRASTGVKWTHTGTHVTVAGQGDTIRYIAKTNGADTLVATHDFCLAGAKCADTLIARVNQQVQLTIQQHVFQSFSFSDSVGPAVTLADRRGNGLPGATIQFVPLTPADSVIAKVSAPIGVTNPTNGSMAVPKVITAGNGTARVVVRGIGADGVSIVATDTISVTVRQVARRVGVEALRSQLTALDSIPIKPVARDARGAPIADAVVTMTPTNVSIDGTFAVPLTPPTNVPIIATIGSVVTGVADPANNPTAPQIPVASALTQLNIIPADTAVAGNTPRTVTVAMIDSTGVPAVGKWVRLASMRGGVPDSIQADANGIVTFVWQAPDSATSDTLTGVRSTAKPLNTLADSAGQVVIRRTLVIKPDVPSDSSTLSITSNFIAVNGTATITVTVRDRFKNLVTTATNADFTLTNTGGAAGGSISTPSCTLGVCTATYTAPAAATTTNISAQIGGVDIKSSPITVTIH
jgi:hypothetical protein